MRHTITLLLAGLCTVALADTTPVRNAASGSIAIFVGAEKISEFALAEMRREVESVTQRTGVRISWLALHAPRETADYPEVVVMNLVGDCKGFDIQPATPHLQKILGSTHMADGRILPFGDVFCEPVIESIRPSLVGAAHREKERLVGRALGRVLSHELYHILGDTTSHAASGPAKATYSHQDLVAKKFRFDERGAEFISQPIRESSASSGR